MMDIKAIRNVYFLGIGGIGMSALARYFLSEGKQVAGYDRTATPLTRELEQQGIAIHFDDSLSEIPVEFLDKNKTLVIRTPAVPEDHGEYQYLLNGGFTIMKRAQVLGLIFNAHKGIAIAGTHGKTSVSTFTSVLLRASGIDCTAFLGGISKNFQTNQLIGKSDYIVAEADEFDRSFLQLKPFISLVTTIDADHLDIYKDFADIRSAFSTFVSQTLPGGIVVLKHGVELSLPLGLRKITYSLNNPSSDLFASDIKITDETYEFALNTPTGKFDGFKLFVPGRTNIENAVAAMTVCYVLGISPELLRNALPNLRGVVRRFDIHFRNENTIYIDDYAHHPRELDSVIGSLRDLYKDRKITGIFQPHLFTRTRDFMDEFAQSLSALDELILLDIYPAREKPLPGVTSDVLFDKIKLKNKYRCSKINLLHKLKELNIDVLLTVGAGDIDQMIEPIKEFLTKREKN